MKNRKLSVFTAFLISTSLLICFTSSRFGLNNSIYAVEQLHAFDGGLFLGNPAIMFGEKTPRFFMNGIFKIFMQWFSVSWESLALAITYISILPYSMGIVNAVWRSYDKNRIFYTVILTIFIALGITLGFPGWTTFEPDTLGLGIAFGFSVWAVSFVIGNKRNWMFAWIMISISMLLHVHEGIWGFVILLIMWILNYIDGKAIDFRDFKGVIIYIIAAALCILPSLATNAGIWPNKEFVHIYANVRTLHHLVPTSWGKQTILSYFIHLLYPVGLYIQYCNYYHKSRIKPFLQKAGLCLASWLGALLFTWLFTEIFPSWFVVTMTVPKYFKYVSLLAIFLYLAVIKEHWESENGSVIAICILMFALAAQRLGFWSLLLYAILLYLTKYTDNGQKIAANGAMVFFLLVSASYLPVFSMRIKIIMLLGVLLPISESIMRGRKIPRIRPCIYGGIFTCIIICTVYGKFVSFSDGKAEIITGKEVIIDTCTEDIYELANAFKEKTKKDEMFLADPGGDNGKIEWFQVVSQRSCYVLWKTVPSSRRSIEEWFRRFMEAQNLPEHSVTQVYELLNEIGVDYILVNKESYRFYQQYESSDLFDIFLRSGNDDYRIYKKSHQ